MERPRRLFDGVYMLGERLATVNLVGGAKVYNEELFREGEVEYRSWNPYRSKLSAAILNGMKHMEIKPGSSVLYLGAATGTTASHVSDIVGKKGLVYCIELSERNMRELLRVCERRPNMLPILADANNVSGYADDVGTCDALYQDVSAKEQSQILLRNSRFLKKGGYAYFAIKSQSIDVGKRPEKVFSEALESLKGAFEVIETVDIEPYDKLHLFAVLKKL
ncbi:MAG: fibrillarin-like rRNA/tRNA 2'-O-methyltransferase [Candidatus Marsarchaeota archaeon]|jgi:fibrillarin-like pre-rRNA processing protein|nr:fibrillarin-like rRNA/tRNA 2'-O-methyltransferase [Candidatus Marsarchaeota archaeon]